MKIVVEEKAVGAHGGVEGFFAGVAERRMAEVVHQGQGFGQVYVEAKRSGDSACYLCDFDGVSEAVAGGGGGAAGVKPRLFLRAGGGRGGGGAGAGALEDAGQGGRGRRGSG